MSEITPANPNALSRELLDARNTGKVIPVPPSSRNTAFSLDDAYAVEAEFSRLRVSSGHKPVGCKEGRPTAAPSIAAGETWRTELEGLPLENLVYHNLVGGSKLIP